MGREQIAPSTRLLSTASTKVGGRPRSEERASARLSWQAGRTGRPQNTGDVSITFGRPGPEKLSRPIKGQTRAAAEHSPPNSAPTASTPSTKVGGVSRCGAVAAKKRTGGFQSTWDVSDAFDRPGWKKCQGRSNLAQGHVSSQVSSTPISDHLRLGALGPRWARGTAAVVLQLSAQGSRSRTRSVVGRKVREQ